MGWSHPAKQIVANSGLRRKKTVCQKFSVFVGAGSFFGVRSIFMDLPVKIRNSDRGLQRSVEILIFSISIKFILFLQAINWNEKYHWIKLASGCQDKASQTNSVASWSNLSSISIRIRPFLQKTTENRRQLIKWTESSWMVYLELDLDYLVKSKEK